ncbi:hypothetical protein EZS27_027319, partial [termite gut metagenome]
MSTKQSFRLASIIIAVSVVFGILIGTFYTRNFTGGHHSIAGNSSGKLNALLHIIDDQYVDTVDINSLAEEGMPQLLAELDPHSLYFPAKKLEEVNSELEGHFSG